MTINVVGAYGRTYDSIISAKDDWDDGKDFKIVGGSYIDKSDWGAYAKDDTVVFQGNSSEWVLQTSLPLDYWDKEEVKTRLVEAFNKGV